MPAMNPFATPHPTRPAAPARRGRLQALRAAALAGAALFAFSARADLPANNYPTIDRVRFVLECMRDHPGSVYEMTNKCSCALDKIADQMTYDEFVIGSTALNANSIGGERGSYIRDAESLQNEIKRYRGLLAESKKACFIHSAPR